jgi:hypothetical protein
LERQSFSVWGSHGYLSDVFPGVRQLPGRAADAPLNNQHKQVVTDNFRDALHVDAPSCFAHGRAARLRATKNSIGKMSVQPLPFYQGIT